jgi:hypothetical protein
MDTEIDTRKMDQKVKKMKKDKKYLWTMAEPGIMHKGAEGFQNMRIECNSFV